VSILVSLFSVGLGLVESVHAMFNQVAFYAVYSTSGLKIFYVDLLRSPRSLPIAQWLDYFYICIFIYVHNVFWTIYKAR